MPSFNSADLQRAYEVYHFLVLSLAMTQKNDGTPNSNAIARRLSDQDDFRKKVSLFLRLCKTESINEEELHKIGAVTTGLVVAMLSRLQKQLNQKYQQHEEPYTKVLTTDNILTVLHKLIELTPEERSLLNLSSGDGLTLFQRALLILQMTSGAEQSEMMIQVYKAAIGLTYEHSVQTLSSLEEVDDLIEETVRDALSYLPGRNAQKTKSGRSADTQTIVTGLTRKAQREIRRLLVRSGSQQNRYIDIDTPVVESYIRRYLQPSFVKRLAKVVVANERLTDEFSVYLKHVSFEPSGPLPFSDRSLDNPAQRQSSYPPLLNPVLQTFDSDLLPSGNYLIGSGDYDLASQCAMRVTLEFYVKLPKDYSPAVPDIFEQFSSEDTLRIDFSFESRGIGGTLSHIIKVINRALLSDIPCLNEYFPIAHDITSTQHIVRDNVSSPIWAHSLVKLCRKETMNKALQQEGDDQLRAYDECAFAEPIGQGDYCGFDFLLAQAQSAMQARLQAIRYSGVSASQYLHELGHRTEYAMALQQSWDYLRGYPFSTMAMVETITKYILQPRIGDRPLTSHDDLVYFDAYLSIIEALMDEGAYRLAHDYLKKIQVLHEIAHQDIISCEVSSTILSRYLICLANYHYLYDADQRYESDNYLPLGCQSDVNREGLTRRAWDLLTQAQAQVSLRLRKYTLINEVSQGTFHPHYALLSRIYFLKTKIFLFHSRYLSRKDTLTLPTEKFNGQRRTEASTHFGRLYLAEKARLYAGADGNSELYACYTSMQCWLYLIASCQEHEHVLLLPETGKTQTLPRQTCLDWAKRLRDHALLSYADTGRRYYNQIKEKSGLPDEHDSFGQHYIQKLSPIYEARGEKYFQVSNLYNRLWVLDMSLLGIPSHLLGKISPNHPTQTIYLFGTNSCYLLFVRGMYMLLSDDVSEFRVSSNRELDTESKSAWDKKLKHATRLLNMSWAIAEEGGYIQRETIDGEKILKLYRRSEHDSATDDYLNQEINSVRDLYPRRVTEIADLGKIFSAACMALRLSLVPDEERSQLVADIRAVLNMVHSSHHLNRTLRAFLKRQKRYNGHLETYFEQAKRVILAYAESGRPSDNRSHQARRDRLLRQLCSLLHEG